MEVINIIMVSLKDPTYKIQFGLQEKANIELEDFDTGSGQKALPSDKYSSKVTLWLVQTFSFSVTTFHDFSMTFLGQSFVV